MNPGVTMKFLTLLATIGALIMLGACNDNKIENYAGTTPVMQFDQFFNGPLRGHAIVQNRSGKIIKTFTVDMVGRWNGNEGSLQEHFVYSDGKKQDRIWNITKQSDNSFIGTASDIIGKATGTSTGMAIQWNYVMNVDVDDTTYAISFDDWMYMMDDHLIINRSTMTKFVFRVGEITISIEKPRVK